MITRILEDRISQYLFQGRVISLFGARRTGKTTLVKSLLSRHAQKRSRYLNCDVLSVRQALEIQDAEPLKDYLGDYELIVLDEAQNVHQIGKVLKILVDTYPEMQIIATGSSSFDLANQVGEPLTGRVFSFKLYPLSLQEFAGSSGYSVIEPRLERFLRFGLYPALLELSDDNAVMQLDELVNNYLYKDVFTHVGIRRSSIVANLVQLLALQVGNEVSYTELGNALDLDRKTVISYIDLLEQCFIVFRLNAYSNNIRKEVSKRQKIYFYDVGVRNAVIRAYGPLRVRTDVGSLWENFCIVERLKRGDNHGELMRRYFWRTSDQKELDYIEERDDVLTGFECKWNPDQSARIPKLFLETYPQSVVHKIDRKNYWRYLLK